MKLHYLIAASLLALSSMGAQAGSTLSGSNGSVLNSGDTATMLHQPGSFADSWSLHVDETTGWANISVGIGDIQGNIGNFSFNIDDMDVTGDIVFDGSNDSWIYSGVLANHPSYIFSVTGTANGATLPGYPAGGYAVAFVSTPAAAPVPIPPAAVLFGSALIGLAAMRRRKAAGETVKA